MNDKIITRAITKTHRNVLVFFFFLFLAGFFTFIALLEGFTVSHLKFGDITIERLYLKWDSRLHVKASLIDFSDIEKSNEPVTLKPLSQLPDIVHWLEQWVSLIDIDSIRYNRLSVSLHYAKHQSGKLKFFVNERPILNGNFTLSPSLLKISFNSDNTDSSGLHGYFNLLIPEQKLVSGFELKLPSTPIIHIRAYGDDKKLDLHINADDSFSSLAALSHYLHIDENIRPWMVDYVKGKDFTLKKLEGSFLYDDPDSLLNNIAAEASVKKVEYTFAPGIDPIRSDKVDLSFKKGKLYINPVSGTFYSLPTEESKLYIDFTLPHTFLYADIVTKHAQLNDSILHLLKYYDIHVPVKQISGLCNVNLKLGIRLFDGNTTAVGTFVPDPSRIQLNDFVFDTTGGMVALDTTKVVIQGFDARYKNLASAKVEGEYEAHTGIGAIRIAPYYAAPTDDNVTLSLATQPSKPPMITYHIDPKTDKLEFSKSDWKVMGQQVELDGFSIPFDYALGTGTIPSTRFSIPNRLDGTIQGKFSKKDFNLAVLIKQLNINDLSLASKPFMMYINKKGDGRTATVSKPSYWEYKNETIRLSPFVLESNDATIILKNIKFQIASYIDATLSGYYNRKQMKGSVNVIEANALSPELSDYIDLGKIKTFVYDASQDSFSLNAVDIATQLVSIPSGWKVQIPDLSSAYQHSPFLRKYGLNEGYVNLYYLPKTKRYSFDGKIVYPYEMMVIDGRNTTSYRISGSHFNGKTLIRVNERLVIDREREINIRTSNVGLNLQEMYRWYSAFRVNAKKTDDNLSDVINLHTSHTDFYLSAKRKILSDTLDAKISEDGIDARLIHDQGSADFQMVNDIIYLDGRSFNDRFMNGLFISTNIKGGSFSFRLAGTTNTFEGIARIDKGVLRDYKLLNNVLSFINTIPSLVTFSLPNYNSVGLPLNEAYTHYVYKNGFFHFDNVTFNSPEMKIIGDIKTSFKEDVINGKLTLKTDIGTSFSKVPVVGYILLGKDGSISTTLDIKGKLSDPKVETSIAKEFFTAPYNILMRTITYPFSWMMDDEKKK